MATSAADVNPEMSDNWITLPRLKPMHLRDLDSVSEHPYLTDSAMATIQAVLSESPAFRDGVQQAMAGLERLRDWYVTHEDTIRETTARLALWVAELPETARCALTTMAEDGWFLDDDMPASFQFQYQKLVDEGRRVDAEKMAIVHFMGRADDIFSYLCDRLPDRAAVFQTVFGAFKRGEYLLVIPVLFSQVDGVCHDVFGGSFFQPGGRKKIARILESDADGVAGDFLAAYMVPFNHALPVLLSEGSRQKGFSKLNRHQVLHGETVDYGTEENALRAISLLNHVVQRCYDKLS